MQNVVLITDPNSDPDDLVSFVVLASLVDLKIIDLKAVIVTSGNYQTRLKRAKFAKGAFIELGLPNIPTFVGRDYQIFDKHDDFYAENEYATSLETLGGDDDFIEALVIKEKFTLLVNSPMADVPNVIYKYADLIEKIVFMGGVMRSKDGSFIPSDESFNNKVCYKETMESFNLAKEHKIPMYFVPKELAYKAQVNKDFYAYWKNSKSIVAKCIHEGHLSYVENLWRSCKEGSFKHFTLQRFASVFTHDENSLDNLENWGEVWQKLNYFNLYDAISALAVVDSLFLVMAKFKKLDKNLYVAETHSGALLRECLYHVVREKLEQ